MPSRPPETEFYQDDANATLWRDISRVYEDFVSDGAENREERFITVVEDVLVRLRERSDAR